MTEMQTVDMPIEVALPPRSDLRASAEILRKLLTAQGAARIDASAVEVLTSPVAQLFCAARTSGVRLHLERPSDAFTDCMTQLGLPLDELFEGSAA